MVKQVIVTPPTQRAVSVADLRDHTEVDLAAKADQLGKFSDAAQDYAEERTYRKLITQTWDQYVDAFTNPVLLKFPEVASVTTVKYTDTDGVLQTLSSDVWELAVEYGLPVVRLKYNQLWPTSLRGHPDDIVIRTVNGYGDPDDVPEGIKLAIRIYASWMNNHREGQVFFGSVNSKRPDAVDAYLGPYRVRGY